MGVTNQGKEKIARKNAQKIMQNKKRKNAKKGPYKEVTLMHACRWKYDKHIQLGLMIKRKMKLKGTQGKVETISFFIATLTLGSRPKQRLTKVQVKSEAQKSHFMLLGM